MGKLDLAYMAGLFDGEGYIGIAKRKARKQDYEINPSYWIRVTVNISDKWICELFRFSFGGRVEMSHARIGGNFIMWRWVMDGESAVDAIKALLPYLHLKRSQAELAIKFQSGKVKRGSWGGERKSPEYSTQEEADYILMRSLKKEKML